MLLLLAKLAASVTDLGKRHKIDHKNNLKSKKKKQSI